MGNMSYCKFENTVCDLIDCRRTLEDLDQPLSPSELASAKSLIRECVVILQNLAEREGKDTEDMTTDDYYHALTVINDDLVEQERNMNDDLIEKEKSDEDEE